MSVGQDIRSTDSSVYKGNVTSITFEVRHDLHQLGSNMTLMSIINRPLAMHISLHVIGPRAAKLLLYEVGIEHY